MVNLLTYMIIMTMCTNNNILPFLWPVFIKRFSIIVLNRHSFYKFSETSQVYFRICTFPTAPGVDEDDHFWEEFEVDEWMFGVDV